MKANLHLDKKSALVLMAIVIGLSILLTVVTSVSTTTDIAQINTLLRSHYEYSAVAQSSTAPDQYIQINAGIWFALSPDAEKSLSVDVVMQTESAEYSDAVYWNTGKLSSSGVAISENIAHAYGLKIGDTIYSKHVVDGNVYGYFIESIIPAITGARISESRSYNEGLVIMGYDQLYTDNISHTSLVFTRDSIYTLTENCSGTPEHIVYREDEMATVGLRILPYLLVYILLSACSIFGLVYFLSRMIEHNFRRLAMIGYAQQLLNTAYNSLMWGMGGTFIAVSTLIGIVAFCVKGVQLICIVPAAVAAIAEIIALYTTANIIKRHLWRK